MGVRKVILMCYEGGTISKSAKARQTEASRSLFFQLGHQACGISQRRWAVDGMRSDTSAL
ncbi:unnamed protein product [Rhodiola kirilowii]